MKRIAFIPAKGMSTRFPRKNMALFGPVGRKPLVVVAATVALRAKKLGCLDEVIVSSNSTEVLDAARSVSPGITSEIVCVTRQLGPATSETARVRDVICEHLKEHYVPPDADLCVLLPTSPLRTLRHIVESSRLLSDDVDVVMSLTPLVQDVKFGAYALRSLPTPDTPVEADLLDPWYSGHVYVHDGTVCWLRIRNGVVPQFHDNKNRTVPYLVPRAESCDVNYPIDLEWANWRAQKGWTQWD